MLAALRLTTTSTTFFDPAIREIAVGRSSAAAIAGVWMIDRRPLARAFLENRHRLLRYLRARGGGPEAEDLLQELWLKVDGEPEGAVHNPASYLFRMAHNLMLDRLRMARRREAREQAYQGNEPNDGAPDAARDLLAREQLGEVAAALAALGPRTDRIFRLYRLDGISQSEIAAELGISLSAVEKHLQKAYRALVAVKRGDTAETVEKNGGRA